MENKIPIRSIVEDLLPLYNEELLSEETTKWMDGQINNNEEFRELVTLSQAPLQSDEIHSSLDQSKMFQKINRRLTLFQLIFVCLSFLLAISTSLLAESFGFILSYTVLGLITYLFYKDMKIAFYITFIPIFLWSMGDLLVGYSAGKLIDVSFFSVLWTSILGSIFMSLIHYLFALIGSVIALLILKVRGRDS